MTNTLPLTILRMTPDCTNHGVTSKLDCIRVATGPVDPKDAQAPDLFQLRRREVMGHVLLDLVPTADKDPKLVGPMTGGNYASSSDSRWHDLVDRRYGHRAPAYAIPVFDRFETQAEYEILSR